MALKFQGDIPSSRFKIVFVCLLSFSIFSVKMKNPIMKKRWVR